MFAFAFVVAAAHCALKPLKLPSNDSLEYLTYARSLVLTGEYAATTAGPSADISPGREPGQALVIAATAWLVPGFYQTLVSCHPPSETCQTGFWPLTYLNALFLAGTAAVVASLGAALGGGRLGASLGALYLAINFRLQEDIRYVGSDYAAVLLVALVALLLVRALRTPTHASPWLMAGLALAGLSAVKAVYLPFAIVLGIIALTIGIARLSSIGLRALLPGAVLLVCLGAINGTWLARNIAIFGAATDARGSIALSTREVFNRMTVKEHAAAFLMWFRGPGDDWARLVFAAEDLQRFDEINPNGFYIEGQITRHEERIKALLLAGAPNSGVAGSAAGTLVIKDILSDIPGYLLSMPALFYRGLWADEFIFAGFPIMVITLAGAFRLRNWPLLIACSPGVWSLLIYAATSLNIPRYQYTALPTLALTFGLFAGQAIIRYQARQTPP